MNGTLILVEPQKTNQFNTVTNLSKILAAVLFIALPFVGLYIGYTFAPEKVVEVEKIILVEPAKSETKLEAISNIEPELVDEEVTTSVLLNDFSINQGVDAITFNWEVSAEVMEAFDDLPYVYLMMEFATSAYPKAIGDGFLLDKNTYTISSTGTFYESIASHVDVGTPIVVTLSYEPRNYECAAHSDSSKDCIPVYPSADQELRDLASQYQYVYEGDKQVAPKNIDMDSYELRYTYDQVEVLVEGQVVQTILWDTAYRSVFAEDPVFTLTDWDINFDGYLDLGLLTAVGYGGVNLFYEFYYWDPITKRLVKEENLSDGESGISNPQFETNSQRLVSTMRSGPQWYETVFEFDGDTYVRKETAIKEIESSDQYITSQANPPAQEVPTQINRKPVIRVSEQAGYGKYVWTDNEIYYFLNIVDPGEFNLLEKLTTSAVSTSYIRTEDLGVAGVGLQAEISLLINGENVYHNGRLLMGLGASSMNINQENGYLYNDKVIYQVFVKCDGLSVSRVEAMDTDRIFTGC